MDQQKDKINHKKTKQSVVSCGHDKEVILVKRIDCSCVSRQFSTYKTTWNFQGVLK